MYNEVPAARDRIAFAVYLTGNIVVAVAIATASWGMLGEDPPLSMLWSRLGRAGPANFLLVVVSLLAMWVDLLLVPTFQLRASLIGDRTRRAP